MANAFDDDDGLISSINVTPLVDVVLVLLIIFMITAPVIYQSAIKVSLPKARTAEETRKAPLTFSLTSTGDLFWNNSPLSWSNLDSTIESVKQRLAEESVVISADASVSHGTVVKLMDALRFHGIMRFALNVETQKK
ncbi:MAG: biopolymer transporter ExbD [Bdellovibrionota bacterium]